MTKYTIVIHSYDGESKKDTEFYMKLGNSIAKEFSGTSMLRVPVLGPGRNICMDFTSKKNFELALNKTNKILDEIMPIPMPVINVYKDVEKSKRISPVIKTKKQFAVVGPVHGESKTLWYVYDNKEQTWIQSASSREQAEKICDDLNKVWAVKISKRK